MKGNSATDEEIRELKEEIERRLAEAKKHERP